MSVGCGDRGRVALGRARTLACGWRSAVPQVGMYRGSSETVEVTIDAIRMGPAQSMRRPNVALPADAYVDQLAREVAGGSHVDDRLTMFRGRRYSDLDLDGRTVGPPGDAGACRSGSASARS